jgi:hypothetical protein
MPELRAARMRDVRRRSEKEIKGLIETSQNEVRQGPA